MDEDCLRQFKIAGVKFCVSLAQAMQRGFKSDALELAVAGDERCGIIPGGQDYFVIKGGGGDLTGDIAGFEQALGRRIERVGWTDEYQDRDRGREYEVQ